MGTPQGAVQEEHGLTFNPREYGADILRPDDLHLKLLQGADHDCRVGSWMTFGLWARPCKISIEQAINEGAQDRRLVVPVRVIDE